MSFSSKQNIEAIDNTLEELKSINEDFYNFFVQHIVYILRLNFFNPKTIKMLIDYDKHKYELYNTIPSNINENTPLTEIVDLYIDTFNKKLNDNRYNKKKVESDKKTFNEEIKKDVYTLLKYDTTDLEEIKELKNKNEWYNIQYRLNDILNHEFYISDRIWYLIQTGYNKFHTKDQQQRLMKLFKQRYQFFVVDSKNRKGNYESKYYYIPTQWDDISYENINLPFKEINRQWLLDRINEEIKHVNNFTNNDVFITLRHCGSMLEYINTTQHFNDNYIELKNVYIHKKDMKVIKKEYKTIYTLDRLGLIKDSGTPEETLDLFTYDPNITLDTLTEDNTTDTLQILTEILVPRQEPQKKDILLYFLQLVGLMVHGNNDIKILPIFYREGNNGKGVLNKILKLLFGNGATDIKQDRIDDNFINEVITDTNHVLINDELEEDTILKNMSTYKQLSGASGLGGRLIHSNETFNNPEIPPLYLASNYIPNIPVSSDHRAMIQRLNLIRMPNIFVTPEEIDETKNEYLENSGIDNIINNDIEGLSQLLSMAINEFKKLDYTKNVRNQLAITPSIQETMYRLNAENPLINYIHLYIKPMDKDTSKTKWITTNMIKESFIDWYKLNNKGVEPPTMLFGNNNNKIGSALETVYGKEKVIKEKKPNEVTKYCYKILSEKEKDITKKQVIELHDLDKFDKEHNTISDEGRLIYNCIKRNNLTNEEDIIQKLQQMGYTTKDIMDYLKELDSVDLIEYKEQITL